MFATDASTSQDFALIVLAAGWFLLAYSYVWYPLLLIAFARRPTTARWRGPVLASPWCAALTKRVLLLSHI
jgi:hypothetical protein